MMSGEPWRSTVVVSGFKEKREQMMIPNTGFLFATAVQPTTKKERGHE
jgi:hypothetical protein